MKMPFIWRSDGAPAPNTWTYFRRAFDWRPGRPTTIRFAADPTARLWINGSVVVARVMRFASPQITVEELDLAPFLRSGRNVAVVLHHWWGVPNFQRSAGGDAGIAIDSAFLRTDAKWKWQSADEFLAHPHQIIGANTKRVRFPVVLDTRHELAGLHQPDFQEKGWQPAVAKVSAAWSAPALKETPPLEYVEIGAKKIFAAGFVKRPDPRRAPLPAVPMSWQAKHGKFTKSSRSFSAPRDWLPQGGSAAELRGGRDGYVNFDFGKPLHGYVRVEIEDAPPGATLDFLYGELRTNPFNNEPALLPSGWIDPEFIVGAPFGDRVILRGGPQVVEIPEERTWRWLLLIWSSRKIIRLRSVTIMSSQHPAPLKGSFTGGPREIPSLIQLSLDHARVTMSDTYVDTTGREDGQWLEDIQYRAQLADSWFGDASLRQVTIRHSTEQQTPNGRFRVFAPDSHLWPPLSLDWGLVWVGILKDDWQWTGETTRLRKYFSNLIRFLEVPHTQINADGLLMDRTSIGDIRSPRRANFDFGEMESTPNSWYYGFLLDAVTMAEAIGREQQAEIWRGRAEVLRRGFSRFIVREKSKPARIAEVWTPQEGPVSYGQGATLSAVFYGIVPSRLRKEALLSAFDHHNGSPPAGVSRWNNPTYVYRALRALSDNGLGEIASRHLLERYRPYLPDGPLPEYFLPGKGQGWAAVSLPWLHDTVLGVRLAAPGGGVLAWQPRYVGWRKASGTVMTPRGPCEVEIDWKQRRFQIRPPPGVKVVESVPR
jgi:hypothetical protein